MANGAIIKYKMPWFKPFAGFSPICNAVFVHTEHCAIARGVKLPTAQTIISISIIFFIYPAKINIKMAKALNKKIDDKQ